MAAGYPYEPDPDKRYKKMVRLRFSMKNAKLYSLQFR